MLAQARRPAPTVLRPGRCLRPRAPRSRRGRPGPPDAAHVPGGEARRLGRLHVDRVVVEEEDPLAGDREAGRHGLEDGGVGLDQARARRTGSGRRRPRSAGSPRSWPPTGRSSCSRGIPPGPWPARRRPVPAHPRRAARASCRTPGGTPPAPARAPSRPPPRRRTPRASTAGLEALHPAAAEPAGPQRLVAVDAGQRPHGGDPAGPDQHAAQVEEDEVDPVCRHGCDARGCRLRDLSTLFSAARWAERNERWRARRSAPRPRKGRTA